MARVEAMNIICAAKELRRYQLKLVKAIGCRKVSLLADSNITLIWNEPTSEDGGEQHGDQAPSVDGIIEDRKVSP